MSLFTKEQQELIAHFALFNWVICLWFEQITLKTSNSLKNLIFFVCFWQFQLIFPFLCRRANCYRCSLPSCGSNWLSSLLTKEWLWENHSCCSLQKSESERSTPFAHDKRAMGVICSFSRKSTQKSNSLKKPMSDFPTLALLKIVNHSFTLKKRAIHTKNQRADSQPCVTYCRALT